MLDATQSKIKDGKFGIIKGFDLSQIFSENATAKIIQVAQRGYKKPAPLSTYPHTVPQTGPSAGHYEEREAAFWTCGFFPGSIYTILERAHKFPHAISNTIPAHVLLPVFQQQVLTLGRHWSMAIHDLSCRTDTHDMGFIVQPALQQDWILTGDTQSLRSVVNAAHALASRYNERTRAIRSWDDAVNKRYAITNRDENFLVIIDSLCNLDLLYQTAHQTHNKSLSNIATTHAHTVKSNLLRSDSSSYHVVNLDPQTGLAMAKLTNQGFADGSTWARGQAWAILGFAQTYAWTRDLGFLQTAVACAEYFLARLGEGKGRWGHYLVPVWDFDAAEEEEEEEEDSECVSPLRDVSAGLIAANGMVVVHQCVEGLSEAEREGISGQRDFLAVAVEMVAQTLEMAYDCDFAEFVAPESVGDGNGGDGGGGLVVRESGFEGILRHSTANWNEHAHKKYKDHGLVYADYYLLEFGNKLLRAGLL